MTGRYETSMSGHEWDTDRDGDPCRWCRIPKGSALGPCQAAGGLSSAKGFTGAHVGGITDDDFRLMRMLSPETVAEMRKQERREDPVTAHRMRLDGYAEARALIHEAKETLDHAETRDVALLMLDRAADLLRPEPK